MRRMLPQGAVTAWADPSGEIRLAEVHAHAGWIGRRLTRIEQAAPARIAFVTRYGEGVIPGPDTVLQEGDLLHVLMRHRDLDRRRGRARQASPGG